MKRLNLIVAAFIVALVMLVPHLATNTNAQGYAPDHCLTGLLKTATFNISSAVNTSIVAPVTGANVYVCGMVISQAVGTGTLAFEYGTGSTCQTTSAVLVGPITAQTSAPTAPIVVPNDGHTQWSTTSSAGALVPSQRICAVSTGTIVQAGYLAYVQE